MQEARKNIERTRKGKRKGKENVARGKDKMLDEILNILKKKWNLRKIELAIIC